MLYQLSYCRINPNNFCGCKFRCFFCHLKIISHFFSPTLIRDFREMATFAPIMNRRHFCKIASLAAGAIGLNAFPAAALSTQRAATTSSLSATAPGRISRPCRVSVLRRECHLDLQSLYLDDPDTGPCTAFKSGDVFTFAADAGRPDGFCPRLWDLIVATASQSSCAKALSETTSIISCPDGTRPVIVRIDLL